MSITLTKAAASHVREMLLQRGHGIGLRLTTRNAGCSGYSYVLDYVDAENSTDRIFLSNGINIFINKQESLLLDGTEIDYTRCGDINMNFEFHNPNVKDVCGCGESFNI
ncbi:MAG: iron-sulfur cluster assembly accessory protein [Gammaproteobacteria bacterium]|nr:iron-sulfur cluster assembly accessory protein [Gammaproteobacteria bacterium]